MATRAPPLSLPLSLELPPLLAVADASARQP